MPSAAAHAVLPRRRRGPCASLAAMARHLHRVLLNYSDRHLEKEQRADSTSC